MNFVFGIPSYKRAEKQTTLSFLNRLGYSRDEIFISTQTEEDYRLYSEKYSDKATILYRNGNCVADNRNTILDELKEKPRILFLDDDVTGIGVLAKEGKRSEGGRYVRVLSKEQLNQLINSCFNLVQRMDSPIWGVSFFDNPLFGKKAIREKQIFIGTMFGMFNNGLRFNREYKVKEDFELCCRVISSEKRAHFDGMTMADYMRWLWNNPQSGQSPYKLFEGALVPIDKDEDGNLVYKFNGAKF